MLTRSARFDSAIVSGHRVLVKAEVWSGVGGALLGTYLPLDGNVQGDVANAVRRTATCKIADPTGALTPNAATDIFTPFGHELRLYRGISYGPNDSEYIPLGVFGMSDIEIRDERGVIDITVTGYDRADKVARAKLTDTYTITAGTNVATAIQALISSRVTGLTYAFSPVTSTLPATVFQAGDDPWAKCLEIAASAGLDLYFDAYGTCVLAPIIDPAQTPIVWNYNTNQQSTVLRINRRLTNRQTFNDVVVTAEGTGISTPVRVEVQDTDPNSPTNVNGPYGKVVQTFTSPLISSTQQAIFAAQGLLTRSVGQVEQLDLDTIPHPAHEPGDLVQVTRLKTGVHHTHSLDAISHPLHHRGRTTHRTRRRSN